MDQYRFENIMKYKNDFSPSIFESIDKLKYYMEEDLPHMTIICSESNLSKQIKNCITNIDVEASFKVCDINIDSIDEMHEDILFSDALIIVTTALRIAPETLYELCKYAYKFKKKGYVMLAGWNALPKVDDIIKSKIEKASDDLPFDQLIKVEAVDFNKKNSKIDDFRETFISYINHIKDNYHIYKNQQQEVLFSWINSLVDKEKKDIEKQIEDDCKRINRYKDYIIAKKASNKIYFENINAGLVDLGLDIAEDDIFTIDNDYYCEKFAEDNQYDYIKEVKEDIISEFENYIERKEPTEIEFAENRLDKLKNDIISDLNEMAEKLAMLKSVGLSDSDKIRESYEESNIIDKIIDMQINDIKESFVKIEDTIEKEIRNIPIENSNSFIYNGASYLDDKFNEYDLSNPDDMDDDTYSPSHLDKISTLTKNVVSGIKDNRINAVDDDIQDIIRQSTNIITTVIRDEFNNNKTLEQSDMLMNEFFDNIYDCLQSLYNKLINKEEDLRS